ncbi:Cas10/Cmr2 second palm domain-containing protein [Vibrio sp. PNB22_4_1]
MTSNNELLGYIEELLNASSTSIPIAQLSCLERFDIYIDLLRGHVPFRGGKIRDFPMSRYRFIAGRLFECLLCMNAKIITRKEAKLQTSFASYINTFYLVERSSRDEYLSLGSHNLSNYYNLLIINLSKLLLSDDKDSVRHITMLLGVSNSEFNRFYDKNIDSHIRDLHKYTEHLLVISNHDFISQNKRKEINNTYGINDKQIEFLESRKIKVISIKTKDVQRYLDKCKSLFILRGASYWCSQVMSIVRDIVLEIESNAGILVDSDSIILLFSSDNTKRGLLKEIKLRLEGSEGKQQVLNKYPRIGSYIERFVNDVFPNIGVLEFINVSLFDLATDKGVIRDEGRKHTDKIEFPITSGSYHCTLVRNRYCTEAGFVPDWYTQTKYTDSFSFDAILFSLCEISFNQQTLIESKYQLEKETGFKLNYSQYGSRITKELKLGNTVSYIKYDGDDIGKKFTSISSIERPVLSFSLESKIKQSLIDALIQVEKEIEQNHLIHDLIYSGGDDLFLSVPTDYEKQFIDAMNTSLSYHLPEVNFTCSVIRITHGETQKENMIQGLISLMSNDLLAYAKSKLKKKVGNTSIQTDLYNKYGEIFTNSHSKGVCFNTKDMSEMEVIDLHKYYF